MSGAAARGGIFSSGTVVRFPFIFMFFAVVFSLISQGDRFRFGYLAGQGRVFVALLPYPLVTGKCRGIKQDV